MQGRGPNLARNVNRVARSIQDQKVDQKACPNHDVYRLNRV